MGFIVLVGFPYFIGCGKVYVSEDTSLFPNEGILTKEEIESRKGFAANAYNRGLFNNMLNVC